MCGLCGSFTQQGTVLSKRDRTLRARVVESLLLANQERGTDSTGIATIGFDGEYDVFKRAIRASKFVDVDVTARLLRKPYPLIMGHTRMTSMGNDVVDQNAHPFIEGNVIGAHNGIINNYTSIDKSVRVDSQAVFRLLDANPDMYEEALSRVSGSCALTWWDKRTPDALFLIAHSNPLSVAVVPRINTVYWSSQSDHLETAMRLAYGRDVAFIPIKQDIIYRLDASNIYEWQESEVDFYTYQSNRYPVSIYDPGHSDDYINQGRVSDWDYETATWGIRGKDADPKLEAERYEEYWMGKLSRAEFESQSESDDDSAKRPERMLDAPLPQADSSGEVVQFVVDDLDGTLECGYCERALGERGVWDDRLEMLLCRWCQKWWQEFGHYANGGSEKVKQAYNALVS